MASARAMAVQKVMKGASSGLSRGRRSVEHHSPCPAGEIHCRPSRPRPAVCRSHRQRLPWGAPPTAISFSTVLVLLTSA